MQFKQMFVTAVCVLFLLKLKWPKSNNFYETIHERYGHKKANLVPRVFTLAPGITTTTLYSHFHYMVCKKRID